MTNPATRRRRIARALRPGLGATTVLALAAGLGASASAHADDYGTFHLPGLSPSCQLFGAGDGSLGQLGGGAANWAQSTPLQFGAPAAGGGGGGGDGSATSSLADPAPFLGTNESIVAVSPVTSTYVLTSDGRVLGSGRNAVGQLGQGDTNQRSSPVEWPLPDGEVAADVVKDIWGKVVYVLTTSGKVFGAGYNTRGQLGVGATDQGGYSPDYSVYYPPGRTTPVQLLLPTGEIAREVVPAPDGSAVFVITESGKVYGAGMNDQGQLGTSEPDQTTTHMTYNPGSGLWDLPVPTPGSEHHATPVLFELPAGARAAEVVPGSGWTMVRTTDGAVYGAGKNDDGRLGSVSTGATATQRTPVRFDLPAGASAKEIHLGTAVPSFSNYETTTTADPEGTTWVITTDGRMFGAGANQYGQLGNATAGTTQVEPVEFTLPAGEKAHEWRIGSILPHGRPWQVYDGGPSYQSMDGEPVSVYVITESGRVFGAGDNSWGQLGNGTFTGTVAAAPVEFRLPDGEAAVDFVTGADEDGTSVTVYSGTTYATEGILAAARTASGKVFGAGNNKTGQLGIGTTGGDGTASNGFGTFGHSTPVRFALPEGEVASHITASSNGISVVTATGKVYGAGDNQNGELGNGSNTTTYDPVTYQPLNSGVPTPVLFDLPGLNPPAALRLRVAATGAGSEPWRARWAIRRKAWSAGSGSYPSPYQFVVACPATMSLGEVVFDDANDNGRKDAGEPGVAGVTVRVFRAGEAVALQTTTTNGHGSYLFNDLTPGSYVVEITLPSGYRSSTDPATGATPNNDLSLDDNGVETSGQIVRSKTIVLDWLGERTLEEPPAGLVNRAVDADSNITVGFGINRIPSPPKAAGTPAAGEQAPQAIPMPVGSRTHLAIAKRALRARVPQGQRVTYRITVRNSGRHAARSVVVCDQLPAGLSLVTTRAENARVRVSKGRVCASWGTMAPRGSRTVALVAQVATSATTGPLANTATASAANARTARARSVIVVLSAAGGALPAVTG